MPPEAPKHRKIEVSQAKCARLAFESAVHFLRDDSEAKSMTGFDIEAYTGAVVERWWGRLVVALEGISASQQMPIFLGHDHKEIVGYSTSASTDSSFRVQGVFSGATKASQEVKALAAEGFPWQASIGVMPKTILEIRENASMVVNGQEVLGPAEVWLESEVFETSFVPLGADSKTRVSVFSEFEQQRAEPANNQQEQSMDLQKLKQDHPDLVQALSAEIVAGLTQETIEKDRPDMVAALLAKGAQGERERIADVRAQTIPGHEALIAKLELDGKSTGADAAKAIVAAEKELRAQNLSKFEQDTNPPAPQHDEQQDGGTGNKAMKRAAFNRLSDKERREALAAGVIITG